MNEGVSWSGRERNCAYLNLGDGRFADVSAASGLDFEDDGRAVAVVDWDGDGDLDLWLKNRTGPQLRYMQNDLEQRPRYVAFRLEGAEANRDAVGATVELHAGGRTQSRTVVAGDGYLSQSTKWVHFGLAEADEIERVVVHWPGGGSEPIGNVVPGRRYRVKQGESRATPVSPRRVRLRGGPLDAAGPPGPSRVLLKAPLPLPPSIRTMIPSGDGDRFRLINLWAHWCEPCLAELRDLADGYPALQAAGLDVVALSLDAPEDRRRADEMFRERIAARMSGDAFPQRPAGPAAPALETVLGHVLGRPGEIALPTSLLVDPAGELRMVYLGPVSPSGLLADLAGPLSPGVKAARRSLYPGRWYFRTPRPWGVLAEEFRALGLDDDARFYLAVRRARELEPR